MGKILIVDDEHLTCQMLATFVKLIGHQPTEAYNGADAWDKLAQEIPDAVLLDIMLPGISGLELCRQFRQNPATAQMPVIMVSAIAPPMQQEASEAGANAYLAKPISLNTLKQALISAGITP